MKSSNKVILWESCEVLKILLCGTIVTKIRKNVTLKYYYLKEV